ncbi:lytic murein transglycosylase [Oceanicella sp. SM1341]|uniref:lytic murein transglycosylase n=1 Tax=Oceanicella sp. SM1341 TaxID=1548889 RepID=UPI000E557F5B|nr:lytic murein transglycosylase [Oceanicella sp. SM1341]
MTKGIFNLAAVGATALLGLAGCADTASRAQEAAPVAAARPEPRPAEGAVAAPRPADFVAWRNGFRSRALSRGIRADVFDTAFAGVGVNERVIELDRYQPEFRRQIWDYLDRAVSDTRVANGRDMASRYASLVSSIESRYGVDGQYVLAIWGLESAYGSSMGSMNVIESLATLAYEGRRQDFAETQLLTALQILQEGDVPASRMTGSWAGAMGHTQFIPTSFEEYAQDWNGDGRRDIWASDPSDALASTANYLARFGWQKGQPWGVEVKLPAGFDIARADGNDWRPVASWRAAGVTRISGGALPEAGEAALLAPAGGRGPVFAVFKNFQVIKRYNNATSYALAVGHLGDRIEGGGPFVASWPRDEQALTVNETIELQERLTALGFDTQGSDGLVGPNTIEAIRAFQRQAGLAPDGFPTKQLLARVKSAGG